ncbi:hypothetical protein Verru16b_00894 [Lacunisphaera limnophila]|uniref:DUF2946 domain-containing protein n=1 Tax=Lacunisphaera limnophila TaxID=1838286 RepID=A0A1D8ASK6_9BACT|nr:hypothetical protein [Lacunisphaera limnophila]AOS43836.1 hypothetical protein Verru16b_00894 [Lacunisphaera limnophila]
MSRPAEHPLTRATALVAALCVLVLAVLAASPGLHAGLHAAPDAGQAGCAHPGPDAPVGDADHACAVTLFAQGAMTLLVLFLLILARPTVAGLTLRATDEVVALSPRYRLVPSHAPPAA